MINRFASLSLLLLALPLTACGGGDDDAAATDQPSPLSGHTYYLNIAKKNWATPRPVGTDLFGVAPAFVFQVSGTTSHLTAKMATSVATRENAADSTAIEQVPVEDAVQDLCGPTQTISLGAGGEIAPDLVRMHVLNTPPAPADPVQTTGDVFGFTLKDVLPSGGTPSTTGTLEATMDFRQLYVLFASLGATRTPDSVCSTLKGQYTPSTCMNDDPSCVIECTPCPNDGAPYCLTVTAEGLGAVEAPNFTIVDVPDVGRPAMCDDTVLAPAQ